MTVLDLIADVLARLAAARESLEYGDSEEAAQVLYDLELDIAAEQERVT